MDLQSATRDIVKKDSLAAIKSEGLLGDKYVDVSFGSKDAERLKDGETIGSEPPLDISDMLSKTNQILDTTKTALINDKTVYNSSHTGCEQSLGENRSPEAQLPSARVLQESRV